MTRTAAERTALLSNLAALRADASAKFNAFQAVDTVGAEWQAARKVSGAAYTVLNAEIERIRREGFGTDNALEMAVLGYMHRRHTDPVRVTWDDLRA